jgi:hypothetical protein
MGAELARARQEEEANQRQLAELQRELEAMGMSAQDAARRAQELQNQLRSVDASAAGAADGFGKVGGAAGKLGGVLGLVSPELGAAAQSMGDFTDMGEVAAEAAGALGLSTAALGPILVGLAAVLGVAALAYQAYSAEIEAAEKEAERLQKRTEMLTKEEEALSNAVLKNKLLRGEITEIEYAGIQAADTAAEVFAARKQAILAETEAAQQVLADYNEAQERAQENATSWAYANQQVVRSIKEEPEAVKAAREEIDRLSAELVELQGKEGVLSATLAGNEEMERSKGGGRSAKVDDTAAKLAAEAAKIEAARQQLLDIIAGGDPTTAENRRYEKQIASIQSLIALTGDQELGQRALNEALEEHLQKIDAIQAAQEKQAAEALKQATDARQADAEAWAAKQKQLAEEAALRQQVPGERIQSATGVVGAVSSGISGLSALGPAGALAAATIGAVTSIVPEEGEEGLLDGIHNTMMEFFEDLGELGPVLGKAIVRSIQEGSPALTNAIPAFVSGIVEALPDLIGGALAAIPLIAGQLVELIIIGIPKIVISFLSALFDPETWKQIGSTIWEGFKKGFGFGGDKEKGSFLDRITKGSHDSGLGRVPEKGLYLLHPGEKVLTEQQAKGGYGQSVVVNIQGAITDDVDALIRKVKAAVDPNFGRGRSLSYRGF